MENRAQLRRVRLEVEVLVAAPVEVEESALRPLPRFLVEYLKFGVSMRNYLTLNMNMILLAAYDSIL